MKKTHILTGLFLGMTTLSFAQNVQVQPVLKGGSDLKISKKAPGNLKMNKGVELNQAIKPEVSKTTEGTPSYDDITGFQTTPGGVLYKFLVEGTSTKKANVGDMALLHVIYQLGDTVIFNTATLNNGKAVPEQLKAPKFNGDVLEGILMMNPGDKAVFKVPMEVMEANNKTQRPPFVKNGKYAMWTITMENVMTKDEYAKAEEGEKTAMIKKDEVTIQEYLKKNKLKGTRTEGGVYIVTQKQGSGAKPAKGDNVTVNYTGKLLNGTVFDSNVDPAFNHVTPFSFPLGQGRVIKGWDEGVAQMSKGTKATLYIPSALAYGKRGAGEKIPENSILIFDIELTGFTPAAGSTKK